MASAETAVAVEMRAAAAACHGVTAVTINNTITDGFSQHDMWFAVPFLTGNRAACTARAWARRLAAFRLFLSVEIKAVVRRRRAS